MKNHTNSDGECTSAEQPNRYYRSIARANFTVSACLYTLKRHKELVHMVPSFTNSRRDTVVVTRERHTWEVSFTSGYILRSTMWLMLDDLPFSWCGSALRSPTQMTFVYPPAETASTFAPMLQPHHRETRSKWV